MIKIGIVGEIGSGKSFVAKNFNLPLFDADKEVSEIYDKDINCFKKLKKKFPKLISKFPIEKKELLKILLKHKGNIKKIGKIVHPYVKLKLKKFLKKNKNEKIVVLDIPLIIENNIEKNKIFLIYIDSKSDDINARLKKRKGFNGKIYKLIRKNQINPRIKKK